MSSWHIIFREVRVIGAGQYRFRKYINVLRWILTVIWTPIELLDHLRASNCGHTRRGAQTTGKRNAGCEVWQ